MYISVGHDALTYDSDKKNEIVIRRDEVLTVMYSYVMIMVACGEC